MCKLVLQAVTVLLLATGGAVVLVPPAQAAAVASTPITVTSADLPSDTPWG
jgi:hypothetical protein